MSEHYKKMLEVKAFVEESARQIFQVYGNELELKLEDYNLLSHKNNCLESSTAIGFIIEEFLVSKLEKYTACRESSIGKVIRNSGPTVTSSYDCHISFANIKTLVNIKAQKWHKANDGVAAINKLYHDFAVVDPGQQKAYLVLKVIYSYNKPVNGENKKITVKDIEAYYLDEINLFGEHKQDHRNWSSNFNQLSGRLQISDKFRRDNQIAIEEISYENTVKMLKSVIARSAKK